MSDKDIAKSAIVALVNKFSSNKDGHLKPSYNETLLRNDFLNPLFEAFGWDIHNKTSRSTNEREVILEENLRKSAFENSRKPDYTFRLFSERKFFLEAKKPSVHINNDPDAARQVRRYGFTAKLKISVLSNFEYLAIYDCSVKVQADDNEKKALVKIYHYTEYERNFDEIYDYLSKDSVYSGKFDKTWAHIEEQLKRFSVDELFLKQINGWRLLLGTEIYKCKAGIFEQQLNDIVQSYLNSIIFLRVCEDRNLEDYQTLLRFATKKDFHALVSKFQMADKKYNSGLFKQQLKEQVLENSKSVFWEIIKQLYYPESPYSFSVFSSDILGNIYETFLAEKLFIKSGHIVLEKKPEHVDRDIITTPTYIINDILKQTVSPFCNGKSDKEIFSARFADIACGSGAFLLETFQLLSDILVDYYLKTDKSKLIRLSINTYKLPFKTKRKLLESCIFGIDKDYSAVQATKFGLLLKLLESEDNNSIPTTGAILPELSGNISFGNSLLTVGQVERTMRTEVNPFNFKEKFNVIVGNPPYMKSEDMKNITPQEFELYKKYYKSAFKQFDKYFLFIEKGLSLLEKNGYLGFIVPSKFIKVGAGKNIRNLLKESESIKQLISFGAHQVFSDKTTYTCLLILNNAKHAAFDYFEVKDLLAWKARKISRDGLDTVATESLDDDVWVLMPGYLTGVYDKINKQSIPLTELVTENNIFNGIQTSANNIYVNKPIRVDKNYYYFLNNGRSWKVEKEVTRPYFQTSDGNDNLYTYRLFQPNSIVIYPYKKTANGIEFIKIADLKAKYPFAYAYLNYHKKELADPKRDVKPEPKTSREWYRYGRHQSLDKCEVPEKIIVGVLSLGNKYAIDRCKTLISSGGTAGYCMITMPTGSPYSIYYIQALLNSKYLEWTSSLIGEVFRGGYIARGTKVLKRLPIRVINFKDAGEKDLHDKISITQKALVNIQTKIDRANNNPRVLVPLQREFDSVKNDLDVLLKGLFRLNAEDNLIPKVSEIYATN